MQGLSLKKLNVLEVVRGSLADVAGLAAAISQILHSILEPVAGSRVVLISGNIGACSVHVKRSCPATAVVKRWP